MHITKSKKAVLTSTAQPCCYPAPCLGTKFHVMVWLRPATKVPLGRPSPPLGCGGVWKETGRNWWVGIRAV